MNSINETLLFDRFLIMYDLCVLTCIIFIFVFYCTHMRMSYVLNSYLLTYHMLMLTYTAFRPMVFILLLQRSVSKTLHIVALKCPYCIMQVRQ